MYEFILNRSNQESSFLGENYSYYYNNTKQIGWLIERT